MSKHYPKAFNVCVQCRSGAADVIALVRPGVCLVEEAVGRRCLMARGDPSVVIVDVHEFVPSKKSVGLLVVRSADPMDEEAQALGGCAAHVTAEAVRQGYSEEHIIHRSVPLGHSNVCPAFLKSKEGHPEEHGCDKTMNAACCVLLTRFNPHTRQHELLLTRRHEEASIFPNVWVTPGGHVDQGETLLEAAVRELCEETGIDLSSSASSASSAASSSEALHEMLRLVCCWESGFPPTCAQGLLKKQHFIAFYECDLPDDHPANVTAASSASASASSTSAAAELLKLCPVEVGAAAWLSEEQVAHVLASMHHKSSAHAAQAVEALSASVDTTGTMGSVGAAAVDTFVEWRVGEDGMLRAQERSILPLCNEREVVGEERIGNAAIFAMSIWLHKHRTAGSISSTL